MLAELIYPTVGMVIASHPDVDYVNACVKAYNGWLQEYCSARPTACSGSA